MQKRHLWLIGFATIFASLYLMNASWLVVAHPDGRQILAHRGLHQTFDPTGVENDSCTANRIDQPRHNHMENTLPSIAAAVNMGADIIEFDIHPTTDGEFMVFHDWTLDCRTNGSGVTRKHDSTYLKTLDIGYGYTADGGKTYPFRGQFIAAMPSLAEVLTRFPDRKFLLNIKSRSTEEVKLLTAYLKHGNFPNRSRLSLYGNGANIELFKTDNPDILIFTKSGAKACLKSYVLTGWSGHVPKACHNTYVPIPQNYQWAIWGWPARFEARLEKVGSRAVLMGPHTKARANRGVDSPDAIARIPDNFGGIVWTNRIDLFAQE